MNASRTGSCPVSAAPPWRNRRSPFNILAFGVGVVAAVIVVAALAASGHGRAATVVVAGYLAVALGWAVVLIGRGHRGWCPWATGLWSAIAVPGSLVTFLVSLP